MMLKQRLNEQQSEYELVRVVDGWYDVVERGYPRPTPVLHFHGRTGSEEYRHWTVDDFKPYFYVAADDVTQGEAKALEAERRVLSVEPADRTGLGRGEQSIDLLRVETELPYHVGQLREEFERTWEADVLFPQRWLIDTGVTTYLRLPVGEDTVATADVEAVDATDVDDAIAPRVAHWDIEVQTDGEFPDVDAPSQPVISVTLYDEYTDSYTAVVVRGDHPDWDHLGSLSDLHLVDSERELIQCTAEWFETHRPDILTGWNSNTFDWPYFVNRSLYLDELSVKRISPVREVEHHDGGGRFVNSDVGGIHLFDMLAGYKKSQYVSLESYDLGTVAAEETYLEKLDVDEQVAYREDPETFVQYNKRDVEATVAINNEVGLI
jgi:DNA polymerase elongation subunit (family B)